MISPLAIKAQSCAFPHPQPTPIFAAPKAVRRVSARSHCVADPFCLSRSVLHAEEQMSASNPIEQRPVALVTGAADRIGAAIATRLAVKGYAVVIHYRASGEKAECLADAIAADG